MNTLPLPAILIYTFTAWFGLYLLVKHPQNTGMRFAGLGILAYGLGLALHIITPYAGDASSALMRWHSFVFLLPAAFWYGAITHLYDDDSDTGPSNSLYEVAIALTATIITGLLIAFNVVGFAFAPVIALVILGFALLRFARTWRTRHLDDQTRPSITAILMASIFFGLGIGAFLLPAQLIASDLAVIAIGFDLALLGIGVAAFDAYREGEKLREDFTRSLLASLVMALIFGGQVVMVIIIEDSLSLAMLVLLLAITSLAVAFQTLYPIVQDAFDRLTLSGSAQRERTELRQATSAAGRVKRGIEWSKMDDDEFTRLTRRALSNLGDLGKLASSPLTQLPMIDAEIDASQDNVLERAATLKALLTENVLLLKPRDTDDDFGVTDEWRYYNALYFPYVVGLKPFSRRTTIDEDALDAASQQALEWFKTYVPERTLYNWQNAAAQLIAQNLREQL